MSMNNSEFQILELVLIDFESSLTYFQPLVVIPHPKLIYRLSRVEDRYFQYMIRKTTTDNLLYYSHY